MLSILTCSHWSVNVNIICGQPTSYCTASADKSNDWLGLHKLPYTSLHSSQKCQIPAACADNWIINNTFPTKTTKSLFWLAGMTNYPIGPHRMVNSGVNHSSLLTVSLPSAINAHLWSEQAANVVTCRLLPITGIAKKHGVCRPNLTDCQACFTATGPWKE